MESHLNLIGSLSQRFIVAMSRSEAAAVNVLMSQAQAHLFQQLATYPSAAGLWHHRNKLQVEEWPMPLHKPQSEVHRHSDIHPPVLARQTEACSLRLIWCMQWAAVTGSTPGTNT